MNEPKWSTAEQVIDAFAIGKGSKVFETVELVRFAQKMDRAAFLDWQCAVNDDPSKSPVSERRQGPDGTRAIRAARSPSEKPWMIYVGYSPLYVPDDAVHGWRVLGNDEPATEPQICETSMCVRDLGHSGPHSTGEPQSPVEDDPSKSPVGEVRQYPEDDTCVAIRVDDSEASWLCLTPNGLGWRDNNEVKGWPVIGAVPGTPAAKQQAGAE